DGKTGAQVGGVIGSFMAFDAAFTGGIYVAGGDVNADGTKDVIAGQDASGTSGVRVFSGATGATLLDFSPYTATFGGGARAGAGGGPHVKVFSGVNGAEVASFFAYEAGFTGGVRVAVADVNADGRYEIRTTPGPGRAVEVRTFDLAGNQLATAMPYPGFPGG